MAEDIAGDRPGFRVVLSLRSLRFSFDPTPGSAVGAALAGDGDWGRSARAGVLPMAADKAGAGCFPAQPGVDADIYGRLAVPGPMAAWPPAVGRARAHSGRRAGRGLDCA